jgi:hypothetical protein
MPCDRLPRRRRVCVSNTADEKTGFLGLTEEKMLLIALPPVVAAAPVLATAE